ncbi:MAG: zinc-binding dehydrogenase [Planctomycetota bacterium]|jgi:6-hydroxycyclohex-1-ene-1-carbonyl-CoA dehydrogenase
MRAAHFVGSGKPLELVDLPDPVPGEGEVLVEVAACGICHTDLSFTDHNIPTMTEPPLVLGHEISGRVKELGPGASGFEPGEPVLLPAVYGCGECRFCQSGRENLCSKMVFFGSSRDGGFAELITAHSKALFKLPASIPIEPACAIADAVSTPYHAVKNRAKVQQGERVVVVGCGGIGINVVQCAAARGAEVLAIDVRDDALEAAQSLGATHILNAAGVERLDKAVKGVFKGGADVAFEAIGRKETIEAAFGSLARGGRLCVVGYCADKVSLAAAKIMFFEQEVVGSLGCPTAEYPPLIQDVADGRIKVEPLVSNRVPLSQINEGFDILREGRGIRNIVVPGD